jgi:hypothetical protein
MIVRFPLVAGLYCGDLRKGRNVRRSLDLPLLGLIMMIWGVVDGEETTFFVSGLWEENGLPFEPTEGRGTLNLPLL